MKASLDWRREADPAGDDAVERLTLRYKVAFAEYRDVVEKNNELSLNGGKLSPEEQLEEEQAFDELDSARYALLTAAAEAYPTIH